MRAGLPQRTRARAHARAWSAVAAALVLAGCGSSASAPSPTHAATGTGTTTSVAPHAPASPQVAGVRQVSGVVAPRLVEHAGRVHPWVALTFDADMTPVMENWLRAGRVKSWYDQRITALLEQTHTPATVFVTGLFAELYPDVTRAWARNPLFEVENHSWDHAAWSNHCYGLASVNDPAAKRAEIVRAATAIARVTGVHPHYFRFPGGCTSPGDMQIVSATGEQALGWDVVSGDPFQHDAAIVVHNVAVQVKPGSIVVMHINGAPNAPATYDALRQILPALRARHLRCVTLAQLLGARTTVGRTA